MKKILFILILATVFIPVSQTGASLEDINKQDKQITEKVQTVQKQVSNSVDLLKSETPVKIKKVKSLKNKLPSNKRDRLFGLMLLAYGGQR